MTVGSSTTASAPSAAATATIIDEGADLRSRKAAEASPALPCLSQTAAIAPRTASAAVTAAMLDEGADLRSRKLDDGSGEAQQQCLVVRLNSNSGGA